LERPPKSAANLPHETQNFSDEVNEHAKFSARPGLKKERDNYGQEYKDESHSNNFHKNKPHARQDFGHYGDHKKGQHEAHHKYP
jgi:hypothetical protein